MVLYACRIKIWKDLLYLFCAFVLGLEHLLNTPIHFIFYY